jgi:hypothetical protein
MTITPDGRATLECCDQEERLRLKMSVSDDGVPSFAVLSPEGKVTHQSGSAPATAFVPEITEALKTLMKLWELAEPLL